MSNLIDYEFQAAAEADLLHKLTLISEIGANDPILFSAPVAAGKTKMVAMVADAFAKTHPEHAFVFVAPSSGALDRGSLDELSSFPMENVRVRGWEEVVLDGGIRPGDMMVVGWSTINSKKANVQTKVGERPTIKGVFAKGHAPIVAFVDEAHSNATKNAADALAMFSPVAVVAITATPRSNGSFAAKVEVDPSDVAKEGKIKSYVCVNGSGFDDLMLASTTEAGLLESGMRCRDAIDARADRLGLDLPPSLMVVQMPNDSSDKDGSETLHGAERCRRELMRLGAAEQDIVMWLSGEHGEDPAKLKHTRHKYLITKLAVSQGWNCPRANPLVKIRPVSSASETLDAQTLGRIMRTADPGKWSEDAAYQDDALLNTAFVYTADETYDASLRGYAVRDDRATYGVKDGFADMLSGVVLMRSQPGRKTVDDGGRRGIVADVATILADRMPRDPAYRKWREPSFTRAVASGRRMTDEIYADVAETGKAVVGAAVGEASYAPDQAEELLMAALRSDAAIRPFAGEVMAAADRHVGEQLYEGGFDAMDPATDQDAYEAASTMLYAAMLENFDSDLRNAIAASVAERIVREPTEKSEWTPPKRVFATQETSEAYANYAYERMPTRLDSKAERDFKSSVLTAAGVTCWWKNGTDKGRDFSLAYGDGKAFYPDFVALVGSRLFVLEVKGDLKSTADLAMDPVEDALKHSAMRRWMAGRDRAESLKKSNAFEDVAMYIVRRVNGKWMACTGEEYGDARSWVRVADVGLV